MQCQGENWYAYYITSQIFRIGFLGQYKILLQHTMKIVGHWRHNTFAVYGKHNAKEEGKHVKWLLAKQFILCNRDEIIQTFSMFR